MALDVRAFETLTPSRFISFTFPNPSHSNFLLRIAALDSPIKATHSPQVAAMFVPEGRETDWIFFTEAGQLQLIHNSPGISRLILVGNQPSNGDYSPAIYKRPVEGDSGYWKRLEVSLKPIFLALSPKSCFKNGTPEIPILIYEDNVICSMVLERCVGSFVGEMLVEDVEIESEFGREFRRRLRFRRTPNLIQTEIRIVPDRSFDLDGALIGEMEFKPDMGVLVHPYLAPMVASLSLIGSRIQDQFRRGLRPKALCLGVGGGALLAFLRTKLEFEVLGLEMDKEVLRFARKYFELKDDELTRICITDAIDFIENIARGYSTGSFDGDENVCTKYDAIMVDLDSSDTRKRTCAPPLEFVKKDVLLAARSVLYESGILAINVIPPNNLFYETLIHNFREVFHELYQIDVENGENYVIVAAASPLMFSDTERGSSFSTRLRSLISGEYIGSMRKI